MARINLSTKDNVEALTKEETKQAMKEGLKEWLDEKFAQFGKWTFMGVVTMAVGGITYLFLIASGWHK